MVGIGSLRVGRVWIVRRGMAVFRIVFVALDIHGSSIEVMEIGETVLGEENKCTHSKNETRASSKPKEPALPTISFPNRKGTKAFRNLIAMLPRISMSVVPMFRT